MKITTKTFSESLIKIRRQKGLSQKDLANITGISPRMIAHYEKHAIYPPVEKIENLAKALSVNPSDLLGFKNFKEDSPDINDFDVRTIKKLKKILLLNRQDRSSIYQMIDLLLQKDEYKNKAKELQEIKSK